MNRVVKDWPGAELRDGDGSPVVLAHEAPFTIGSLRVEPATRRVLRGDGAERIVEPLVMQMLVALGRADGAILTRDELVERCWGGRIVGDDSIARVIARLRKLGAEFGEGAFGIETITKVGYRLTCAEAGREGVDAEPLQASGKAGHRWPRSALLAFGAAALGGVAAFAVVIAPEPQAASLSIGVEPAFSNVGDREASRFASDVTADLARYAEALSRVNVVDSSMAAKARTDLLLRVAVEHEARTLTARARLVDADDGSVIWSRAFRDPNGNIARLRDQTASGIAGVIGCGLERSARAYDDRESRRLYFAACDAVESQDWQRAESLTRQIVARRPDVAAGWACLAMSTIFAAWDGGEAPEEAVQGRARRYAERALQLDPKSGLAFRAVAVVSRETGKMSLRVLEMLEQGLRADPENRSLHSHYAIDMFNAGYVKASVPPAQRALALDPASQFAHGVAVRRLLAAGRVPEAFAVQATAERLWPDNQAMVDHRIRLLPYWADAERALAELNRLMPNAKLPALMQAELASKLDPASIDLAEIEREAEAEFGRSPSSAWYIAALMTRLGQHDRALAWLARAPRRYAHNQWSLLFWPEVAPLRRDARFFHAMAELGLVDLWRARGQWPDFCSEPGLRYDCRTEAARIARKPVVA